MSSDNKKCPYCGEFLNPESMNNTHKQNGFNVGCLLSVGIIILLVIMGAIMPDEFIDENTYSGFGTTSVAMDNWGGQNAHCIEEGAGKSLVNELEKMINESSPNNNSVLYYIKEKNPNLKFNISNPRWDESIYDLDRCRADITFKNYDTDTIAGYTGYGDNRKPYTTDEAQYGVTYYVSELGGRYKAHIRVVGSDPIEGYYD